MAKKKRIRMLTAVAGANWYARPKQVVEIDADEADRFIARGFAVPVEEGIETASLEAPENAAKRTKRAKGKKA